MHNYHTASTQLNINLALASYQQTSVPPILMMSTEP